MYIYVCVYIYIYVYMYMYPQKDSPRKKAALFGNLGYICNI